MSTFPFPLVPSRSLAFCSLILVVTVSYVWIQRAMRLTARNLSDALRLDALDRVRLHPQLPRLGVHDLPHPVGRSEWGVRDESVPGVASDPVVPAVVDPLSDPAMTGRRIDGTYHQVLNAGIQES